MNIREQAKAFVEALALNAVDLQDVVAWADAIILKESPPEIEFIELAGSQKESDAITFLNIISNGANEELSFRILFGLLPSALKNGSSNYEAVSRRLYFWSMYESNLDKYNQLGSFWDEINLAERGSYGNPQEVKKRFIEYLNEHQA